MIHENIPETGATAEAIKDLYDKAFKSEHFAELRNVFPTKENGKNLKRIVSYSHYRYT